MSAADPRPLAELSLAELWELFPIVLREPGSDYADWYEQQRRALTELLGAALVRVSHIGSTAVPGLVAKPTVDILAELEFGPDPSADPAVDSTVGDPAVGVPADLPPAVAVLEADGWTVMSQTTGPPWKVTLNRGYTPTGFAERVYHLHLRPVGDWEELYFRDYLIEHPAIAREYAELKRALAARFARDRDGYTAAKSDFVRAVTDRARSAYPGRYVPGRPGGSTPR